MIARPLLALGGVLLAGAATAQDLPPGDPDAGRQIAAGQCRTCHGLDGYAQMPQAPHIGGESAAYLADQLLAFRSGAREHEMMSVIAAGLSDGQIADVSAWFADHRATATLDADPDAAPELCASCHGADGIAVVDDAPNIAGEPAIYLISQLKAFQRGQRDAPVMMSIAEGLSEDDMRAAADWYSNVTLTIAPADGS